MTTDFKYQLACYYPSSGNTQSGSKHKTLKAAIREMRNAKKYAKMCRASCSTVKVIDLENGAIVDSVAV